MGLQVEGLADLQRALAKADRDVRLGVRKELREVAEPVRSAAQQLAGSEIRNMPRSPQWAGMRVGITRNMVYVAPRRRGVKTVARAGMKRPNMAGLLMNRAMQPALNRNHGRIEHDFDRMLDGVADRFNHGGPL